MTDDEGGDAEEQLQIWESAARRQPLGTLGTDDGEWEVYLVVELVTPDLYRGRIAFRRDDEYMVTAPVIVEEGEAEVVRRAEELPRSMIRQFHASLRG